MMSVIPTSGSVDLDVTVTTEDGDANSQILPFTVTDQLDILGTNAINSLQLMISKGARGQHTHYPEPPTSPGVMFTDLQGVPGPVEA